MIRASAIRRAIREREALGVHPDDRARVRREVPLSPIFRECPFCCAKPLRECVTMGGRRRKFHQQRRAPTLGRR